MENNWKKEGEHDILTSRLLFLFSSCIFKFVSPSGFAYIYRLLFSPSGPCVHRFLYTSSNSWILRPISPQKLVFNISSRLKEIKAVRRAHKDVDIEDKGGRIGLSLIVNGLGAGEAAARAAGLAL